MLQYLSLLALAFSFLASTSAGVIKRSPTERFFLANCGSPGSWTRSQIGYFDNNAEEIENEPPVALFDFGRVVFWEGNTLTATLSNGNTYNSQINADAAGQPLWATIGTGTSSTGASIPVVLGCGSRADLRA